MELGVIFSYWLKGRSPGERTQFNRRFLGYTDKSQFGKYSCRREGLMSRIPHVHVSNSLFIIREEDLDKIKNFCQEFDALCEKGDSGRIRHRGFIMSISKC